MAQPILIAHRGYSAISPENSFLAFELAYQFCFSAVELDVHLTKDQQLVIIHDANTKRTSGLDKVIADQLWKELQNDNQAQYFPLQTLAQPLMSLEQFLNAFAAKFNLILIEIKTDVAPYPGIEKQIDRLMQNYQPDLVQKVIFFSSNFATLQNLKALNPRYQLGWFWWTKSQFAAIPKELIKQVCTHLGPSIKLYEQFLSSYQQLNLPLILWMVKNQKTYQKYRHDPKIFGLLSDYQWPKK